ncbi:hypothetical protein L6R52_26780, partial [Myxococcota bacterium]|nr:hypothetical protein [Myxococcota bacterium]
KAAEAERAGREAARENALASARMSLDGTASALDGGVKALAKRLGSSASKELGPQVTSLAERVAKLPASFGRFDANAPDARRRLEAFEQGTIGGLRRAREALPELTRELQRAEASQKAATDELTQLRRALSLARNDVATLRANGAPAAEVKRWEKAIDARAAKVDDVAAKLKDEVRAVAECARQLERLTSNVPYAERQAWSDRDFQSAATALEGTFGLTRAPFGADEAEWKVRIGLVEKGLTKALDQLELDALVGIGRAHASSFDGLRYSLVLYVRDVVDAAARLGARLGDDVKGAIDPVLRARAEGVIADFAKLGAAFTEVSYRNGTKGKLATHVRELHSAKLEATWNREVDFSIDFDRRKDELRWATRDPTKFYSS